MPEHIPPPLVFIVGVGRSGTSLLQSMLNAHPSISFTPELHFVRRFLVKPESFDEIANGKQGLIDLFMQDEFLSRLGFDVDDIEALMRNLPARWTPFHLYVSAQRQYAQKLGRHETGWLGDKDPRCIEFLPLLASLFSDMRVLHIIRDPRDVLASKKKAAWSRDASVLRHVFANRVQLKMGRRWGEKLFGDAYMELFYEDLICEPEKELTRVCELLGLDFDARMLEFGASGRQLVSESEMQWKKETLGPLLRGNRGKWKGCLSDFETALAERACAETMRVGNYDPSGTWQRLSKLERARCMAIVAGFSLGDPIYRHMRVRRQRL